MINLNGAKRILITGSPKSGKTTLSREIGDSLYNYSRFHTDDLISPDKQNWSEVSQIVSDKLYTMLHNSFIYEGVAIPRALRKFLNEYSEYREKPCDLIIYMPNPRIRLTKGQESMRKGVETVWREILPQLISLGVRIENV